MSRTTAVFDRSTLDLEQVKQYLRVDIDDDDSLIEQLLASAKIEADGYLMNPFLDKDGNPDDIPEAVNLGVLRRIAKYYDQRTDGVNSAGITGLGTTAWQADPWSMKDEAYVLWVPFKRYPWEVCND